MWIKRIFEQHIGSQLTKGRSLPIKVLRGPRQVGKTSLLARQSRYRLVSFDDLAIRNLAERDPRLFFDQWSGPLILDEATLTPNIFSELKRRVDEARREGREVDYWITGSNQTLLQKSVQESLAGRANYFDLNTLSLEELPDAKLEDIFLRGGWPELHKGEGNLSFVQYLNDFVQTFIERDIIQAAGIERRSAFALMLQLAAGRVGQLWNASDVAKSAGAEVVSIQSWMSLLEQNGILRKLSPYFSNLNKRLMKTPKYYFEDTGLAIRLQGWTQFEPLMLSPHAGHLFENLVVGEVSRYFMNRGEPANIFFVRSKEGAEVDLLIALPNHAYVAAEIKMAFEPWSSEQKKLIESLRLNILERWTICAAPPDLPGVLSPWKISEHLDRVRGGASR